MSKIVVSLLRELRREAQTWTASVACSTFSRTIYKDINLFVRRQELVTMSVPFFKLSWQSCCHGHLDSRKEVFQPHLPVRLPCYDLAPVTSFTLGRSLRSRTLGTPSFHGLTGGVYKARERIHRAMADARLLANPASRSRVADSDPNWERVWRLALRRRLATFCPPHCNTCVAPDVRAVLIWRHPHLPHTLRWQSH